jgi:hypothetical protein
MTNTRSKWPLEGFFTCAGGGLSVEIDCLGTTFESRTASHPLTVTLPQLDSRAPLAPLARPAWKFRRAGKEKDSITVAHEDWGAIGGMRVNGEQYPHYAEVQQCIIHSEIDAKDEWEFRNGVSAFGKELDAWWRAFTGWLGILLVQDFTQLGVTQLSILEYGFHAWSGDEAGQRHTPSGSALTVVRPIPELVTADILRTCADLARKSHEPPTEWVLIRDARSLAIAGEDRRALLDAGTAAELALTALLETHLFPSGEAIQKALFERYKTLGGLKDLALQLIPQKVPEQLQDDLITPRNDAIHTGEQPVSRATALKAIAKATELVALLHPVGG